jgi:hypothetical protein
MVETLDMWTNAPLTIQRAWKTDTRAGRSPTLVPTGTDPANAVSGPLVDTEQEELAHTMADVIYSPRADDFFSDDITQEQADRVWEQCLIDARRMLCDEDYARIFEE